MPISPPSETMLAQAPMELMSLFGRMRTLTDAAMFSGTLPVVWQCSDESQKIKKSLFGYVYDCPVFNLGRVGEPALHADWHTWKDNHFDDSVTPAIIAEAEKSAGLEAEFTKSLLDED